MMDEGYDNDTYEALMAFYNETIAFERMIGTVVPLAFALIIVIGLIGNFLVVVVALSRQMRNSTNTLIVGLAFSDLMFLLLCVPFTAIDYASPVWIFPEWICPMINFFQHTSAYCSVWTLTLMAFDRYLAVVHPVSSMTLRTPKNTVIVLTVIYAIIMFSQIPVGLMHGIYTYEFIIETRSTCATLSIATQTASDIQARTYFIAFNVFGYIVPLGISCLLYWRMLTRLWDMPRPGAAGSSTSSSVRGRQDSRRAKKKVTKLVTAVLIIWAVCWLPLNVCFFMSGISYPDTMVMKYGVKMVIVQIASQVLAYTNSCLNPLLYALMSESFRNGYIRIIRRLINHLSCGMFCSVEDKNTLRMDLTNYNGTTTINSSVRRPTPTPRMAVSERSVLLQNSDERKVYIELGQNGQLISRPTVKSFEL